MAKHIKQIAGSPWQNISNKQLGHHGKTNQTNSWGTMAKQIKQTAGSPWQNKSNKQMLVQNYKTMTHRGQKWHFKKVTVNSCLGNVRSPEQSVRNVKTGTKHTKLKHFR